MEGSTFALLFLVLLLSAAPMRLLPLLVKDTFLKKPLVQKVFKYIPVSMFSALLCSELFFEKGSSALQMEHPFVYASLPTFCVAYLSKSLSLSILVGILSVAFLS